MPFTLGLRISIAANATNTNVLSGTAIEFIGQAAVLTLLANMDGAALGSHTLTINLPSAPITPIPSSALNQASSNGTLKADEDLALSSFPLPANSRLVHSVSNADTSPHNYNGRYFIQ